ncbi:hypothetical protein CMI43_00725 [Candidatus Pacearchaeota archaeon]|nr:hypothetical protein [Candidatus Pacearchaeota archaeon]|tara:strand:- start:130 stop:657 length:528 start_codon:yes stop_codon:yes gene_type:complete
MKAWLKWGIITSALFGILTLIISVVIVMLKGSIQTFFPYHLWTVFPALLAVFVLGALGNILVSLDKTGWLKGGIILTIGYLSFYFYLGIIAWNFEIFFMLLMIFPLFIFINFAIGIFLHLMGNIDNKFKGWVNGKIKSNETLRKSPNLAKIISYAISVIIVLFIILLYICWVLFF